MDNNKLAQEALKLVREIAAKETWNTKDGIAWRKEAKRIVEGKDGK